ncbi:MAG: aminotransferase class IV [Deltaproteobacteria bacterium]|nr:aminotransferase class IV [Deltaproteobacteria bacterium]
MKPERRVGKVLWWNGKMVAPEQAVTSVFTHSLHYGLGAFEGIRCYKTQDGKLAVFRLDEHIRRLFDSCKILELKIPYSVAEITQATLETVRKSGLDQDIYIRPLIYIGDGPLGVFPTFDPPVEVAIMTWVWGAYLGKEAKENGARIKISSLTRGWVNSTMTKAKMTGGYTTGILAKLEVKRAGYDEALLLDTDGYVANSCYHGPSSTGRSSRRSRSTGRRLCSFRRKTSRDGNPPRRSTPSSWTPFLAATPSTKTGSRTSESVS